MTDAEGERLERLKRWSDRCYWATQGFNGVLIIDGILCMTHVVTPTPYVLGLVALTWATWGLWRWVARKVRRAMDELTERLTREIQEGLDRMRRGQGP